MTQDLIDLMTEFHAHEMGRDAEADSERKWLRWCGEVERLSGLDSLDGDEAVDGYSLDSAYQWYVDGETPAAYVATLPTGRAK